MGFKKDLEGVAPTKPKKGKKKVTDQPETVEIEGTVALAPVGEAKPKGAPRPRRYDYGITPEAVISKMEHDKPLKSDTQAAYTAAQNTETVAAYTERGGDRHGLRVLMRRGLIKLTHANGEVFPKVLVADAPEAPAEESVEAPAEEAVEEPAA